MKETTKQRVRKVIDVSGLSIAAFERKLGWGNGYYNSCSDRLSLNKIQDVVNGFGVDRNWLITGKGEMFADKAKDIQQEIDFVGTSEPTTPFVNSTAVCDSVPRADYEKLKEDVSKLIASNDRLTKELAEQGKRMDIILEMLKSKI